MEIIIASIVLSLSTNIDNLAVGAAYGIKKFQVSRSANLLIALLSGISTFASMSLGDEISRLLAPHLAQELGSGILIFLGCLTIANLLKLKFTHLQNKRRKVSNNDIICGTAQLEQTLSIKEAWVLGLALTITNWGTGIGAGIAQLDSVLTSCLSFLSSLIMIGGGAYLGNLATTYVSGKKLEFVAGILLIGLGFYEYVMP